MTKVAIDQEARNRAVDPRYSYVVQAPAGSGKTELLTDRILALLAMVKRPEDILAITFTRKAAAEMRERVMLKLEQALQEEPAEIHKKGSWQKAKTVLQRDRELGWHLFDNPNRLRIQTIDSFCQSLVRMTPSLSGAGASLSPTENSRALFDQAVQRTLSMLDKEPCVAQVLSHLDVNVGRFHELLVQMLAKRQNWLKLTQDPQTALEKMVETLDGIVQQVLEEAIVALGPDYFEQVKAITVEAAHMLASKGGENPLKAWLTWDGHVLRANSDDIPLWKGLVHLMLTKDGNYRAKVDAKNGVDAKSPYKKAFLAWLQTLSQSCAEKLHAIRLLPDELITDHSLDVFPQFFECLALCERCLQEVFKEQGEVDFNEISLRALRALGSQEEPTEMLLKIDADLKHILIDEFQDTNLIQKELLDLITSGWSYGDGRTLFLVGDPMQSIYRFRNAEVSLFLKIAEEAKKNQGLADKDKQVVLGNVVMDLLLLEENFRSDAGVVNWVNQIFKEIFPTNNQLSLGGICYTPSNAFKPMKFDPAVRYYPFTFTKDEEGSKDRAVQQALQCGVKLVKEALQAHPESDNAVAVLVRSRSHLAGLAQALAAEGIPVQAVKMVPLGATEEVSDLVQLVRALSHRNDRLAWMSLLRAPFCGLTLKSLTHLFENQLLQSIPLQIAHYLQDPVNVEHLIGKDEATRLAFIHQAVNLPYSQSDMTFTAYIEQCWERLGANRLYASEAAQENIQAVLKVVDTLAPYGGLDLNEFERKINDLFAAPTSEKGAVQIMTMHSSKGLEFNEVILFGLHKQPRAEGEALLEIESEQGHLLLGSITHKASGIADKVSTLIRERNKERQEHEVSRLLYVACTRAKEKLHLVYVQNAERAAIKSTMLARLETLIDSQLVVDAPEVDNIMPSHSSIEWEVDNSKLKRYPVSLMEQLSQQYPSVPVGFSVHQGGAWIFEDKLPSAIGTTAHYWLEQMGLDKLHDWSIERIERSTVLIKRQLRHLGVESAVLESAAQKVIDLLSGVLNDEKGRWLLSHPGATQEWSLFNEEEQNRIVDVAISTEEGWLIVDYKTNQRFDNESIDAFKQRLMDMYSEQLKAYALYLHQLDGRAVKTAIYALDGCVWIELF